MIDHDPIEALERRASAAAADLRARAGDRPVPAWHPVRSAVPVAPAPAVARPRPARLLAAAAVIVVLAATAAVAIVAVERRHDDTPPTSTTESGEVLAFETLAPPNGLELSGILHGERYLDADLTTALAIYGTGPDAPEVGVARVSGWTIESLDASGEHLTVDGTPAVDLAPFGMARHAVLIDDPARDAGLIAMSPTISPRRLIELLRSTTVDDGSPRIAGDALPSGWRLLGSDPSGPFRRGPMDISRRDVPARAVTYGGSIDREGVGDVPTSALEVTSEPTPASWELSLRLRATEVQATVVAGRPALLATGVAVRDEAPRWLAFEHSTGVLVQVIGWDLPVSAIEAAADQVAPITADRWSELEEQDQLGLLRRDDERPVLATGTADGTDGLRWALRVDANRTLDLRVAFSDLVNGTSGSSTTNEDPDALVRSMAATTGDDQRVLALLVRSDVASLRVGRGDQARADVPTTTLELDAATRELLGATADSRLVVVLLRADDDRATLLDDAGDVLATHVVRDDGLLDPEPLPGS